MNQLESKLREAIDWEIGNCKESGLYPEICEYIQTKAGYEKIVKDVINLVDNKGLRIDSALAQIESNL